MSDPDLILALADKGNSEFGCCLKNLTVPSTYVAPIYNSPFSRFATVTLKFCSTGDDPTVKLNVESGFILQTIALTGVVGVGVAAACVGVGVLVGVGVGVFVGTSVGVGVLVGVGVGVAQDGISI